MSKNELDKINNRIKYIINQYSIKIFSQINANNKGNYDFINVGLMSLYMKSRDLIKSALFHRNKNNYYSANILIRTVFENPLIFIRLYDEQSLELFFKIKKYSKNNSRLSDNELLELMKICKQSKLLSDKTLNKLENHILKKKIEAAIKIINFEISDISKSRKHFAKINKKISKQDLDDRYKNMCEYTHFGLLKIGQYKHHLQKVNFSNNDFSYDYDFDKETIANIILSLENLIFATEHICKNKVNYDKKMFDKIYYLFDKNRAKYKSL
ncbi:MAG: hypothetical protein KAQ92_04375 [Candidatus Aenigmarchaeota archaeon]|nr:hypothetical protein [Candidatus Aenigmarchaeota archaeon]